MSEFFPAALFKFSFTPKERKIVPFVARGMSHKEIADAAKISVHTLRVHLDNIRRKCGNLRSRSELVSFLAKHFC